MAVVFGFDGNPVTLVGVVQGAGQIGRLLLPKVVIAAGLGGYPKRELTSVAVW